MIKQWGDMIDNLKIIHKKVKNISIKIKPTLEVILTVPFKTPPEYINKVLEKRKSWILKHLEKFKISNPYLQNKLYNDNTFIYLGKQYDLEVLISDNNHVELAENCFYIYLTDVTNVDTKLQLIDNWYKKQAKHYFKQVIEKYIRIVNKPINHISIKRMKTRWGSCNTKKGYINLNIELMKKSPDAIEYVILHELTHLIHANHSKDFYNYIASYMPDWKIRQSKLGIID